MSAEGRWWWWWCMSNTIIIDSATMDGRVFVVIVHSSKLLHNFMFFCTDRWPTTRGGYDEGKKLSDFVDANCLYKKKYDKNANENYKTNKDRKPIKNPKRTTWFSPQSTLKYTAWHEIVTRNTFNCRQFGSITYRPRMSYTYLPVCRVRFVLIAF